MLVRPSACTFHNNHLRFVTVDFDSHTGTNTAIASYILDRHNEHTLLGDAILKAPVLTDLRNTAVAVTHGSQALCVFPASPLAFPHYHTRLNNMPEWKWGSQAALYTAAEKKCARIMSRTLTINRWSKSASPASRCIGMYVLNHDYGRLALAASINFNSDHWV